MEILDRSFYQGNQPARAERGRSRFRPVGIALSLLISPLPVTAERTDFPKIQVSSGDQLTRISIETVGPAQYKSVGRLRNPERLYFDLLGVKSVAGASSTEAIPVADELLKRIRVAQKGNGITRVVLDLKKPHAVVTSHVENPDRFVIELRQDAPVPLPAPAPILAHRIMEASAVAHLPNRPAGLTNDKPPVVTCGKLPRIASAMRLENAGFVRRDRILSVLLREKWKAAASVDRAQVVIPAPAVRRLLDQLALQGRDRTVSLRSTRVPVEGWMKGDAGQSRRGSALENDLGLNVAYWLGCLLKKNLNSAPVDRHPENMFATLVSRCTLEPPAVHGSALLRFQNSRWEPMPDHPRAKLDFQPRTPLGQSDEENLKVTRSLTRALGLKVTRVVLDPGHGGDDLGAVSRSGLKEKDLVLDVARRVGNLIEARSNIEVIYTRSADSFVPLEARPALAEEKEADLLVSIHANWSASRFAAGPETYYLNFTGSNSSLEVAARENAGSSTPIHRLEKLVRAIALHEKVNESRELASSVEWSLFRSLTAGSNGEKSRGVKQAPFLVLIGSRVPSILVEIGFLSNTQEQNLLKVPEYRQRIADALYQGVARYIERLGRFEIAQSN